MSLLFGPVGPSGLLCSSVLSYMGLLVYTVFLLRAFSFGFHALRASWPLGPHFFADDQINGLSQYHWSLLEKDHWIFLPRLWEKADKNHKPIRSTTMSFTLLPLYSNWPPKGFLPPEVLLDLSNFCQRMGKRKELPCTQSSFLSQCWRVLFFRLSALLLLSTLTLLPQLPQGAESSLWLGMFCFTRYLDLLFKMPPFSSCPVPVMGQDPAFLT